jgi:dihydroorotase-like cyclic amidohydrolase
MTAAREGRLTTDRIIELVALRPQQIFGVHAGSDTYTLVDPDASFVITRDNLHTKCGWSPFEGKRVWGKVTEVWIRGQKVFDGESVLVQPGFGCNLYGDHT